MEHLQFPAPISAHQVLSQFETFRTSDVEEARNWGTRVFCENRLRFLGHQDRLDAYMYYRRLGGVGVGRMSYGGDILIDPGKLDSFLLIQMPISGHENLQLGKQEICSTPSRASIINAHEPVRIHHTRGTEKLIIRIDRNLLEHHCQQHLGHGLRQAIEFNPSMDLSTPQGQRWMRMASWLYDTLSSDDEPLNPMLKAQFEQSLIAMVLACQPSNYSAELSTDDRSVAPAFVRKVERYIEEHAHEPITIVDLAEFSGVSSRSLFSGFRRYRNTSPIQYLKEVRLRRVHDELKLSNSADTTVTATALHWGFNHLGHFTTDYKKRFGESPSTTLTR